MELSKYPPSIEGTIPAFCLSQKEYVSQVTGLKCINGGLRIPYVRNSAIMEDTNYIKGFQITLKDLNNKVLRIIQLRTDINTKNKVSYEIINNSCAKFFIKIEETELSNFFNQHEIYCLVNTLIADGDYGESFDSLNIGQYYKIQLAYIFAESADLVKTGANSAAAITKYTSTPNVTIDKLEVDGTLNHTQNTYSGLCEQKDITEPIYSYQFIIRDKDKNIYATSGELIYDISTIDKNNGIFDNTDGSKYFKLKKDWINEFELEKEQLYELSFSVRTLNNLVIQSPFYTVLESPGVILDDKISFNYEMDKENGYVNLKVTALENNFANSGGNFILMRADEASNYKRWYEITRAAAVYNLNTFQWQDRSVEQGRKYKYALVQYNDYGIYSSKLIGNDEEYIVADFEHMFLSDSEKQLKIKFNPKVSSFKNTVLESKTDTIGGKYPFVFRNGDVKYKEILISGLISYLMDDNETFMTHKDLQLDSINIPTTNLMDYNYTAERDFKLEVLEWLNNGKPKLFRSPAEGNYVVRLMNVSLSPEDKLSRMIHTFSATGYEIMPNDYNTLKKNGLVSTKWLVDDSNFWTTIIFSDYINSKIDFGKPITDTHHYILEAQFSGMKPGDKVRYGDNGPEMVIGASGTLNIKLPADGGIYYYNDNSFLGSVNYNYKMIQADMMEFNHITNFSHQNILCSLSAPIDQGGMFEIVNRFVAIASSDFSQTIITATRAQEYQLSNLYYLHFYLRGEQNEEISEEQNWISINTSSKQEIMDNHIDLLNTKNFFIEPALLKDVKKIWIGSNTMVDIYFQRLKIEYDKEKSVLYDPNWIAITKESGS